MLGCWQAWGRSAPQCKAFLSQGCEGGRGSGRGREAWLCPVRAHGGCQLQGRRDPKARSIFDSPPAVLSLQLLVLGLLRASGHPLQPLFLMVTRKERGWRRKRRVSGGAGEDERGR